MEAFPSLFLRTGQGRVHLGFHRTAVCIADVGKPEGLFQAARLLPPPPVNLPAPGPNPENMTGASSTAVLTPPRLPATSGQGPLQHRKAFAADGRISLFERPPEDAPSKCRIRRRSRGSDRQKSHECGGLFSKSIAPIGGEPTDSRAGLGFVPATGHLGGKHCAN